MILISLLIELVGSQFSAQAALATQVPGYIASYQYTVTDVASRGFTAQRLFNSLPTSWMDLEHSVCSKRAQVWAYELKRKFNLNAGVIFVFFGEKVWRGHKKKYWYHAAPYVVENGVEKVLEASYPQDFKAPLSVVEWMAQEMEDSRSPIDAARCVELDKDDTDMTEYFLFQGFLPNKRLGGKPAYDCYYRKVPAYLAYPSLVGEIELGRDVDGNPTQIQLNDYDRDILLDACIDSFAGKKLIKRPAARTFCEAFLKR